MNNNLKPRLVDSKIINRIIMAQKEEAENNFLSKSFKFIKNNYLFILIFLFIAFILYYRYE